MPIKILHVLDHSFPVTDGYAFRSAQIMRFEQEAGMEVEAVTSAKHGPFDEDLEEHDGLRFHRTPLPEGLAGRLPLLDQWSVVHSLRGRLEELVPRLKPDLLHVHSPPLNGLAAIPVARRHALPVVYEIRAFWEDAAVDKGACREGDLRYRLTRAMETHVCRKADRVITICEGLRNDLLQRGIDPGKTTVVANAVDTTRFGRLPERDESLARDLGLTQGKTLGFIGSFFTFEGLSVLVDAMPAILEQEPAARLLLVGDGVEAGSLRDRVRDLGMSDQVIFTGRVSHGEVERYYGLIDLLVYPRLSMRITELVTPLKPLEAMAQGKPVLASDVGGHRELIDEGVTGTLFRAGDPASLAENALALLSDSGLVSRLTAAARAHVLEHRCWSDNAQRLERIYLELLAPGRNHLTGSVAGAGE